MSKCGGNLDCHGPEGVRKDGDWRIGSYLGVDGKCTVMDGGNMCVEGWNPGKPLHFHFRIFPDPIPPVTCGRRTKKTGIRVLGAESGVWTSGSKSSHQAVGPEGLPEGGPPGTEASAEGEASSVGGVVVKTPGRPPGPATTPSTEGRTGRPRETETGGSDVLVTPRHTRGGWLGTEEEGVSSGGSGRGPAGRIESTGTEGSTGGRGWTHTSEGEPDKEPGPGRGVTATLSDPPRRRTSTPGSWGEGGPTRGVVRGAGWWTHTSTVVVGGGGVVPGGVGTVGVIRDTGRGSPTASGTPRRFGRRHLRGWVGIGEPTTCVTGVLGPRPPRRPDHVGLEP